MFPVFGATCALCLTKTMPVTSQHDLSFNRNNMKQIWAHVYHGQIMLPVVGIDTTVSVQINALIFQSMVT